jgi:hypothetical protein
MVAIKYDVEDVETGGGGEEPQPGMYAGKIVSVTNRKKKAKGDEAISDLEVVVDIGTEFVRLWTYIKLPDDPAWNKDAHGWKLRELTDALGLPPKGSIDPAKITKEKPAVSVKVSADTNMDGGYRGRIKNLFLPSEATATPAAAAEGGGEEGPYDRDEIESWEAEDIKGYAEELGVDIPTGRGAQAKLIDAILVAQDEGAEEPEAEEPEGDATDAGIANLLEGVSEETINDLKDDPDHYADWPDEDVAAFIGELGLDGNVKTSGRGWRPKAITAITEFAGQVFDGSGGDAAADDAEDSPKDDYDDEGTWPTADLLAEFNDRNEAGAEIVIEGRKTRPKLIEALRQDNINAEAF